MVSEPECESEEVHGAYGDLVAMLQQIILHDYQTTLTQVLAYISLNSFRYTCLCHAHVRALHLSYIKLQIIVMTAIDNELRTLHLRARCNFFLVLLVSRW